MAMSVVYTTINGEILHEVRNGVEHYYVPDTNGNTVQLLDAAGNKTDEWTYWPFGEVRTRTGTTATPFTFGGALGYYTDRVTGRMYVRARHLRADLARWQTVDPLWPHEPAYEFAADAPDFRSDSNGLRAFGPAKPQNRPCIYGNYCGPCDGNGFKNDPIDELDACCQAHDSCLAKFWDWINPLKYRQCQCGLAACSAVANCHLQVKCNIARISIAALAEAGCLTITPFPQGL